MAGEFNQQNDREARAILFVSSQKFSPSVEINTVDSRMSTSHANNDTCALFRKLYH